MKRVIKKKQPDFECDSFVGVPGSKAKKRPRPTKVYQGVEILVLNQMGRSVGRFCRRLNYKKKCIQVSDITLLNTDINTEPSVSHPSNSRETRGKKFSCKLCGVKYCRKGNLVSHMRIHTGETPYCCELCGKAFRRSDWLKLHMQIHMGKKQPRPKRFICDQCGMKFDCSAALQSHIWKHRGERPLPCVLCEKTFYSLGTLRRHKKECHSAESRRFSCSMCGHIFKRLHALQKHTRIHTGERPYSCSQCGKCYRHQYTLFMHNKLHSCNG
ncbi:oocyte zinc finger protein XlCOF19-like [Myxocyprinus asiaticus]|uniref:oocyte zinc finger protein XlCOF19-like n=1 Tax=Myxocyprinus asiaticus TaxID=70543 RepID=UPI0022236A13|nr:oocyte zinc finger protein XlCOF19-like [Myxocyprinus asiaticus]XP_051503947.1 oocyte zinc finger protein XlCOF19-like [Myxocyprinus asiaticus]